MKPLADKKNILILGSAGFLGTALARCCQQQGHAVRYLIHHKSLADDIIPARIYHGSLWSFNWDALSDDMPQIIYHLARIPGQGALGRRMAGHLSAFANRRLLRWLRHQSHPPLLVLVAGTLAYGNVADREITEDEPLHPVSFARAYHIGEQPIVEAKDIPRQIMRVAWAYGNGSWFKSFYLRPMHEAGYVPLYGDGNNYMSLVHVEDAAGLIEFFSSNGPVGETFNVFCGSAIEQKQLAEVLHQISGLPIRRVELEALRRLDKDVAEAFTFSLQVGTRHQALYQRYLFKYPQWVQGIKSLYFCI